MLVNVYGRAVHLRNTSAEHTRASRVEARAISVIRNDLRNARLSGGKMAVTLDTGDSTAHSQFPGDLRFDTTTGRINEDTFAPELLQVEYYITPDSDSPDQKYGALKRAVNRTLLGTMDQPDAEETILSGVESMDVGFFDGNQWQTTWDTSSSGTGSFQRQQLELFDELHGLHGAGDPARHSPPADARGRCAPRHHAPHDRGARPLDHAGQHGAAESPRRHRRRCRQQWHEHRNRKAYRHRNWHWDWNGYGTGTGTVRHTAAA